MASSTNVSSSANRSSQLVNISGNGAALAGNGGAINSYARSRK
ncbi:hypothetical protein DOY81_006968 [Sarcophaga bullata]|nr:hypothetical protein DOY81_006968 [Sarcophaga bullata]